MQLLLITTDIPRLTLREATRTLGYKDMRSAKRWCKSHNVALLRDAGTKCSYVIKSEFIAARFKSVIGYLNQRYGTQHFTQALTAYTAGDIAAITNITGSGKKDCVPAKEKSIPGKNASRFHAQLAKITSGESSHG